MKPHNHAASPRIVWLARTFLDYRVPVFEALQIQSGGRLHVVCAGDDIPEPVLNAARATLGGALTALTHEWRWGAADRHFMANRNLSVRWHPGLPKELRRLAPEVIISDGFFKWTTAALWHRWCTGTPLVIAYERTAHTERHAQAMRTAYRRFVARRVAILACTGTLARAYAEQGLGVPPEQIVEGHMVADVPAFTRAAAAFTAADRAAWRQRWDVRGVLAVCVGRLIPRKGCRELLHAWCRLVDRQPDAGTLMFVGDGPEGSGLQTHAAAHGAGTVRFCGPVPHAELARYYSLADVLVLPTLEDNWSLVVPEAMACGLPVACSRYNGGHPELVHPDRNGWLFDPLDPTDLDAMLTSVTQAAPRLAAMGAVSRTIVASHTPAAAAAALLAACRLARGGGA